MSSKRDFFLHLIVVIALFVVLIFGFFYVYLPWTTNHGQSITVPNLTGKTLTEIDKIMDEQHLRYHVNDSVYAPDMRPLSVISQYPKVGNKVKENRKIYITVSSLKPPLIKMPKLIDASLLNAQMVLQSYGLRVGKITKRPYYAQNAVLEQLYQGNKIQAGDQIGKGSYIDLVVGDGISNVKIPLPNLVDFEMDDALRFLESNNIEFEVFYDENSKKEVGIVSKQKPAYQEGDSIRQGQTMEIFISGKNPNKVILEEPVNEGGTNE